jgi:MoaA/NifB/PqqE/SkfB family radical SAM enzyme
MKPLLFGLKYVLDHLRGRARPLIRGLVLTNRCNLRCRHCKLIERGFMDLSFDEVRGALDSFYQEGGRCLYLQGGEPFVWRDDSHSLEDVVLYAHSLGFLTVVVYTNGMLPIRTSADTVFVSVDGLRATHDALRGRSFDRIMQNIQNSGHASLFINYTVNSYNKNEIGEFCEYLHGNQKVRGIFFYFHTPYYGRDELRIEPDEKQRIVRRLMNYKRRYKILNSRAGLESALRNDWRRPLNICSVYEKGALHQCCRYADDIELCAECGYLSYAEIDQTLKLRPSAIRNALHYF